MKLGIYYVFGKSLLSKSTFSCVSLCFCLKRTKFWQVVGSCQSDIFHSLWDLRLTAVSHQQHSLFAVNNAAKGHRENSSFYCMNKSKSCCSRDWLQVFPACNNRNECEKNNQISEVNGSNKLWSVSQNNTHWMPLHASLSSRAVRTPSLLQRWWMHGHLMSDSENVAGGLVAWDQTKVKAVLPSDCPHVVCQGSYLQRKGSANIKGRLPAPNPAVTRFPVHLAWGNVCPSHWTDSKISSKP